SREEARRLVDYAQRLAGSDEGLGRLVAAEHVRLGSPDKAVEALGRLAARRPRDLGLRLDLARLAHASGRGDAALRALAEARRLCARAEDLRLLAEAYRDVGETRRAARLLTALAASGNEGDLAELARLHMTMREYDRSLRLLDELVFRSPENARWRNDRAITLAFLGRKEEAIVELRLALAKDPGMRSAAQSLAALLSSTGQLVIDPDRTKPPR
ncbi:MAG: tetratricopeptide repeat protein, partial [Elusimicrobia bacterium]|nr:tetratricopeptide repeat protein [Elusimicrobiota bacterium]